MWLIKRSALHGAQGHRVARLLVCCLENDYVNQEVTLGKKSCFRTLIMNRTVMLYFLRKNILQGGCEHKGIAAIPMLRSRQGMDGQGASQARTHRSPEPGCRRRHEKGAHSAVRPKGGFWVSGNSKGTVLCLTCSGFPNSTAGGDQGS